ncbi:phosphotransferase family protein [Haladaptatus salinisoli]|uniref:phosphotransferase family protein n=1 Tax=Haladaptatus salinisoli TaxID=2884876 RepID=UPI001D0A67A3|nr:phosphotransferase [Haladaptatus salinisoli]
MIYDRTISHETITEMVQHIEPTWEVQKATPADDGHHIVYHLDIEAEIGRRQCVLKATPPEKSPTCDDEARLLAILDTHTSLPIPDVLGVVDEHEYLPTPFFLSSTLPGANHNRIDLTEFSETAVERLARSTGRHLAELHSLDAVDSYGFVGVDADETLSGERPSARVEQIVVQNPTHSWVDYLTAEVDRVVTGLDATRFGDLGATVRPVLEARIHALSGEFDSVIARIDQSLDNVLLDSETSAVTGLLDWEFCIAATPAYDLAFVEHSLSGGNWKFVPEVPDHQATIRSAMLDGYSEARSSRIVEQFRESRDCYALLANLHSMLNFEDWFDQVDATDEQRRAAVDPLRKRVESFC